MCGAKREGWKRKREKKAFNGFVVRSRQHLGLKRSKTEQQKLIFSFLFPYVSWAPVCKGKPLRPDCAVGFDVANWPGARERTGMTCYCTQG